VNSESLKIREMLKWKTWCHLSTTEMYFKPGEQFRSTSRRMRLKTGSCFNEKGD